MEQSGFGQEDIDKFISEVREQQIDNMFVTPKNIDESIKRMSFTVSEALNSCFADMIV
jgi:spore protease